MYLLSTMAPALDEAPKHEALLIKDPSILDEVQRSMCTCWKTRNCIAGACRLLFRYLCHRRFPSHRPSLISASSVIRRKVPWQQANIFPFPAPACLGNTSRPDILCPFQTTCVKALYPIDPARSCGLLRGCGETKLSTSLRLAPFVV